MSTQNEALRAEVDDLRDQIAEEKAALRADRAKANERHQTEQLTSQRDALKAELAALRGDKPASAPAKAPAKAPAAPPTSAEPGDDDDA